MKKQDYIDAIREITPDFDPKGLKVADLQQVWEELTEAEEEGESRMSKTLAKYREKYVMSVSPSGRKSLNNGDPIAAALEGRDAQEVLSIAEQLLGFECGELVAKYERLNPGQRRMNGGNRIRSAIKRGDVTIEQLEAMTH